MPPVRVRFAPSPTGFFHIGSARTALFNWLYARHTGGVFILRIEDTDQARNSEEFLRLIYDSMRWLGLDWDEGPEPATNGQRGAHGPYRQSQRAETYRSYLQMLRDAGRAYDKDGAVWFKLEGERYRTFDDHRKKEVEKVKCGPVVIEDQVRGRVERMEDEDFVIFRSDGNPVFHFVNVVDDIAMNVTHVIRGEDHLSNTSKHVRLYEGFGAQPPVFAHIPLILKSPEMGPGKMSKRDKGALIEEYRQRYFLPEAVVNYLSLLGWNPGDDREKMPIKEIEKLFDFPGINQSNAKFDSRKLDHMNMLYTLEEDRDRYVENAREFADERGKFLESQAKKLAESHPENANIARGNAAFLREAVADESYFRNVVSLFRAKGFGTEALFPSDPSKSFSDLFSATVYFFSDEYPMNQEVKSKVLAKGDPKARLDDLLQALPGMDFSSDLAIETAIKDLATAKGLGFGDYQAVARLAVTGTNAGPSITSIFRLLGKVRVDRRLRQFRESV
ncbi:MAG TPA: glutamate--tRNA ligase family protein [Candidatus Didemnitutus sp.]